MACTERTGGLSYKTNNMFGSGGDASTRQPLAVPQDIFDPEPFEDVCELLGSVSVRTALGNLSMSIDGLYPDPELHSLSREEIFKQAHELVSTAGMLGFPALRDALYALQAACKSQTSVDKAYEQARGPALAAREAIAVLLQRAW
jgi:HPt (histidine-containing phosphotransfer) domain-containing protein